MLCALEYGHAAGKSLLLDLYLPKDGEGPLPLIVWVHGGAWSGGDKSPCRAAWLVERGYAVASVNYRLSREAIFPAQIHDCKAAIRWLRANAVTHSLDPERIGVWGSSAGGHLVGLLGTSGDVKDLEGDGGTPGVSSRVQAVCDWFGPTDFLRMQGVPSRIDRTSPDAPEAVLVGGPLRERKEECRRANPITYITPDDPPFLIMHGDGDDIVPINQSELLHEALKKAGVEVTYHVVEGAGHGFGGPELNGMVADFFKKHLKPTHAP